VFVYGTYRTSITSVLRTLKNIITKHINRKYKHSSTKLKKVAILCQQLAICGQSLKLKIFITKLSTSVFSMKILFFCQFVCRFG